MARHDHTRSDGDALDLDRLALSPGEAYRLDFDVVPGPLALGGSVYRLSGEATPARLDVSRTAAGYAFRLRFRGEISGPCMRCLEDARAPIEVDAREVDQPSSRDEELLSPYASEGMLEIGRWAHDALALALPQRVLCRAECAGLCPVCGESLNDAVAGAHEHERAPDPRWAKLRELQE